MNVLKAKLTEKPDYDDDFYVGFQGIKIDGKSVFTVSNLTGCPEDAIIGRDLFDAYDYIRALNYGIELAKKGIDKVEIEKVEDEERD